MVLATQLSHQLGLLDAAAQRRIIALIASAALPITSPNIATDVMLEHMSRDKKNEGGAVRLILLKAIGASVVDATVSTARIRAFLDARVAADL